MGRLTNRSKVDGCPGIWVKEGFANEGLKTFFNKYDEGYAAIDKLVNYEDIIDDPEKLKLIDALYLERCKEINRLNDELAEKEEFCEWEVWDEEANCYHTSCENAHFFVEGNPKDNNHVYCPYCGRKIKEV